MLITVLLQKPQSLPPEEILEQAIPFKSYVNKIVSNNASGSNPVAQNYCEAPSVLESQIPFWIKQNYGTDSTDNYLIPFLKSYYNWLYCGFKKEEVQLTPYDIEELLDIDRVPDAFLEEYIKSYAPFISLPSISSSDRQYVRSFLRSIKSDFLIAKGTEPAYRYLLKTLYNVSNVNIDYPKKYLMRLNGGKYIDFSWDIVPNSIIDLPENFDPNNPIDENNILAGNAGYNTDNRSNLFGAALNEAVLPDNNFWQEFSYILTSDADDNAETPTYKNTVLAGTHPAGMLGFFEKYVRLDDVDTGGDNNDTNIPVDYEEFPVIKRYLLMSPEIPAFGVQGGGQNLYAQYVRDNMCTDQKNYECYCCYNNCDPLEETNDYFPEHVWPNWDIGVKNNIINKTLGDMTIENFIALSKPGGGRSPNADLITCALAGCSGCTYSENPSISSFRSFYSDDASKVALFDANQQIIIVYDVSYTPTLSVTALNTIDASVADVDFDFDGSTERCLISNDGNYLVLSSPSNSSVFFFDVFESELLQTISEDYDDFGSKIAVDKDFLGMAISTRSLTRAPSSNDTRVTSFGVSSPIMYYKRNFGSNAAQRFKKIHTQNAVTNSRHNGLASLQGISLKINTIDFYNDPPLGSLFNSCGINRCDDIACKGYNFALSNIALEADQINYKAHFPNTSNSKYNVVKDAGFTFSSNYTNNMMYKVLGATGTITLVGGITMPLTTLTDNFVAQTTLSNYYMEGTIGLKNFSITRKVNNQYTHDGSYRDSGNLSVSIAPELNSNYGVTDLNIANPSYNYNFMSKMYTRYVLPFFGDELIRPKPNSPNKGIWDYERYQLVREEAVSSKVCINSTDTYNISKFITNGIPSISTGVTLSTQNLNIPNIRIYRFPSTNIQGTDSYFYNDFNYTGSTFAQEPNSMPYGWLKVMYKSSDQTNLENAFIRNDASPVKPRETPVLANPTSCPSSEFAYTISSSILSQDIEKCYVSDDRLFVVFTDTTMIFSIDTTKTYKPLLFEASLESLSEYSFAYNANGEYFTLETNIYKYNRTTHVLDLVGTIG
jgi:hypothetical protein